ncbi:MAG TPA: hypothetical protein VHG91_06655 [Longimicrobium sp.]|nr:hypothetical protein [Longimicrobium sp.]
MAHVEQVPDEAVEAVVRHLGRRLAAALPPGLDAKTAERVVPPVEVAESLPVWTLHADRLSARTTAGGLEELVEDTGSWHHQIRRGGRTDAFARSEASREKGGGWGVTHLFGGSPVAAGIDAAVSTVDGRAEGDPRVRLLVVPAFHLHALWLSDEGGDRVVVADAPPQYGRIARNVEYDAREFLDLLARERQIVGLTGLPPAGS